MKRIVLRWSVADGSVSHRAAIMCDAIHLELERSFGLFLDEGHFHRNTGEFQIDGVKRTDIGPVLRVVQSHLKRAKLLDDVRVE